MLDLLLARGVELNANKCEHERKAKRRLLFIPSATALFALSQTTKTPSLKKTSTPKNKKKLNSDAHGEAKVAYPWLAPTEPAKWKEEHTVFVVLGGWAIAISSAMKIFGGGKKEDKAAAVAAAPAK